MRNPFHTPFVAVFQNEVLLNSKRVAPYALMIVFSATALIGWGKGPAVALGWATNSDWYIVRGLLAFSFLLGLPIFNAVIMGDPVIRDFRTGIDPLIFSKPVTRAQYLFGKFFGNFFVLVCCQAVFPLTQLVLQAFPTSRMIVQPVRVFPYFKHFLFFVVITHLVFAAFYFTVGTLTRNSKIVYGLAVCFYPLYISYGVFVLKGLPPRLWTLLDPMQLTASLPGNGFRHTADFLNQYVVNYSGEMMANRLLMLGLAGICLTILYLRFSITEPDRNAEKFSLLNLSTAAERLYYDPETLAAGVDRLERAEFDSGVRPSGIPLPEVARENEGLKANWRQLVAATALEVRLLRSERSLIVLIPLVVLVAFLSLPFSTGTSVASYSAAFAANTASGLLLFLLGVIVFFIGESIYREREVKIESVVWSTPAPNNVFLLSKFLATLLLMVFLVLLAGLTAMLTQVLRGQTPIELSPYLLAYVVILLPSLAFIAAASLALNVLLREKYLAYAITTAIGAGQFYLYTQGHNRWPYNPVLYGLWTESDLVLGSGLSRIVLLRAYSLALMICCLLLAHTFFGRRNRGRSR